MGPRIIPRKEHHISRKQVSPNALRTLYRLHSRGFIACLVGGCVRDLLLGRTPKDFDIGTNATPGQIKRLFHNCRLVGRRFRLAHLRFQDEIIEVSTFRRAAEESDIVEAPPPEQGRRHARHMKDEHGMVLADNIFGTPEEDALRRDFTINALTYNIADASVIDYSTGLADLKEGLIRSIGDPYVRFTEDPVRMVRAVRFAASHGFSIEEKAWDSIRQLAPAIARVSPSRLWEEMQKLFLLGSARLTFALLHEGGLLSPLLPGLGQWLEDHPTRFREMEVHLGCLDDMTRSGEAVGPAMLLAVLFGPRTEEVASERHRDGIPRRQALDHSCADLMQEIMQTVHLPGRAGTRLAAVLALETAMCRVPPRRPRVIAGRPEFTDALIHLRMMAKTHGEFVGPLKWWEAYCAENPPDAGETPTEEVPKKKKKRRRRRSRRSGRKEGQAGLSSGETSLPEAEA